MDTTEIGSQLNQQLENALINSFFHVFLPIILSVSVIGIFFLITKLSLRKITKNRKIKLIIVFVCDMLMLLTIAMILPKIIEKTWESAVDNMNLPEPYEGDFPFEQIEDSNEYVDPYSEEYQNLFKNHD